MKTGIYPGTFDPITIGHADIIQRALAVVDKLIIAVAADIPKTPIFSLEKRVELVKAHLAELDGKNNRSSINSGCIEVVSFKGLLVDFAEKNKATILIRGLRAVSDFEHEFMMSCMNSKLKSDIVTVLLPASEDTQFISSRFVKEIASLGGDISCFVGDVVKRELQEYYK